MTDTPTSEQIAEHYDAMGKSVELINDIVAGNQDDKDAEERQDIVDRNVRHLELTIARDFWTDENMTAVNSAITSGKGYTAK
tara:strand:- start:33 stop:278 length:246 start_codon:yes stop_codon:yes gene_type:complete